MTTKQQTACAAAARWKRQQVRDRRKVIQAAAQSVTHYLLEQVLSLETVSYDNADQWYNLSRKVDYCAAAALEAVQGLLPLELQEEVAHLLAIRDYVWYLPSASAACAQLDRLDLSTDTETDSQDSAEGETP